jgi:hypothetical protein
MTPLKDVIRALLASIKQFSHTVGSKKATGASLDSAEWQFVRSVMRAHHFTAEAQRWIEENVNLRVDDLSGNRGGGYWAPSTREVRLFSAQHEAAVHELAHAWWHYRREAHKDEMIEATVRLSAEPDRRYAELARLAFGYVHGIPEQPWEGLLVTRNDWEMFAGLASGTMGDMRKLPPYVRELYRGLFEMPA